MGITGLTVSAETLGALLTGKSTISVPLYQRFYSWERKQIDSLIDDIEAEITKPRKDSRNLFLGTIVFNTENVEGGRTTDLIDGQQRLFTLALIELWWIRRLAEIDSSRAGAVLHMLKGLAFNDDMEDVSQFSSDQFRGLLRLQSSLHDRVNYESLMRRGKGGQRGRSRLVSAYRVVDERMVQHLARLAKDKGVRAEPDDSKFKELTVEVSDRYNDFLRNRISFGVIEVSPPFNPFSVFESLNSKGLELAQSDLIKNFLLKQLGTDTLRKEAVQQWDAMVAAVPGDRIVEFLRAWYIAYNEHVQRAALYEVFRDSLGSKQRIGESLADWNRTAWWFRAFHEGRISDNHEDMANAKIDPAFRRALEDWSRIGFKQGVPVLLSLLHPDVCDPTERAGQMRLVKGMRLLEAAYVRLFVTGNVRGSVFENKLEKMCQIGRTQRNAVETLGTLLSSICDDEGVGGDLDWSNVSRNISESRFLLYRIAEHQAGNAVQLVGTDKWHVEHILPQTNASVSDEDPEEYAELVSKIGNLTLLLEGDNSSLGNGPHKEKMNVFRLYDGKTRVDVDGEQIVRPRLAMNLDIVEQWPKDWNEETIRARGKALGNYASKVWSLDIE
jgi:hypothetical protein